MDASAPDKRFAELGMMRVRQHCKALENRVRRHGPHSVYTLFPQNLEC